MKSIHLSRLVLNVLIIGLAAWPLHATAEKTLNESLTGMELVHIKGECFQLGSPAEETGRKEDEKQRRVCVGDFYLGKTEVTQAQWEAVMGSNPAAFEGKDHPVENVSWFDAQTFIDKLNHHAGRDIYRLPSEAEWEYAARGGTTSAFYTGRCIDAEQANYDPGYYYGDCVQGRRSRQQALPVASFAPNPFGLFDMAGNVWEWTCSKYEKKYGGNETRCVNKWEAGQDGVRMVRRGGSWSSEAARVRSASRNKLGPGFKSKSLGFRVLRLF